MSKLIVPTDVAGFTVGQELTDVVQIAAFWRAAGSEMEKGTFDELDDETLVSLTESVEDMDDKDEYILAVLAAIEEGGEEEEPLADNLRDVAQKVADSKVIGNWVERIIQGHKDIDSGPVSIAADMLDTLSPQELAIIPWPGSKSPIGNRMQDVTETEKAKTDGGTKKVSTSAIKAFIGMQPRIIALHDAVKRVEANVPQGGKVTEFPAIQSDLKNLNKQITNASRAYTFAIKLALLFEKLGEHPHVEMEFDMEDYTQPDGKAGTRYANTTYCVTVSNRHKRKETGTLTVAGVTRAAFAIIDNNTTYTMFMAMLKRKKAPATPTTKYPLPTTVAEFGEVLSVAVHSFAHAGLYSQLNVALAFTAGEQKEQADDLAWNLRAAEQYINDLMDKDDGKLRKRATAVAKARQEAKQAKAA